MRLNDKFGINYFCARTFLNYFLDFVIDNDALFFHFFDSGFDFAEIVLNLFVTSQTEIPNDSCQVNRYKGRLGSSVCNGAPFVCEAAGR